MSQDDVGAEFDRWPSGDVNGRLGPDEMAGNLELDLLFMPVAERVESPTSSRRRLPRVETTDGAREDGVDAHEVAPLVQMHANICGGSRAGDKPEDDSLEPALQAAAFEPGNVEKKSCPGDAAADGSTCSICLEPWDQEGNHRLVSLTCGHLFGLMCVVKWLKQAGKCPTCKKKKSARKGEGWHPIYAPARLTCVDNSELETLHAQLKQERARLNDERRNNALLRMASEALTYDNQKLRVRLEEVEKRLLESDSRHHHESVSDLELTDRKRARVEKFGTAVGSGHSKLRSGGMAFACVPLRLGGRSVDIGSRGAHAIYASCALNPSLPRMGYGLVKLNTLFPNGAMSMGRSALHLEPVRDIRCCPHQGSVVSGTVATVGDKVVRVVHPEQNFSSVISYAMSMRGGCVSWLSDPNLLAVGGDRSCILLYDLRNTAHELASFDGYKRLQSQLPIHSLSWSPSTASFLASTFDSLFSYRVHPVTPENSFNSVAQIKWPTGSFCHSMSVLSSFRNGMQKKSASSCGGAVIASFRSREDRAAHHVMMSAPPYNVRHEPTRFIGHRSRTILSRTAGVACSADDGEFDFALFSGDEGSNQVYVWRHRSNGAASGTINVDTEDESGLDELDTGYEVEQQFITQKYVLGGQHQAHIADVRANWEHRVAVSISDTSLIVHRLDEMYAQRSNFSESVVEVLVRRCGVIAGPDSGARSIPTEGAEKGHTRRVFLLSTPTSLSAGAPKSAREPAKKPSSAGQPR
ncbi:E3 ubiquitin-protein ligase RFWD3 [Porphyridium purpureum]|uniref:E3 ubiquitin-protein ligase RFWD3 n=1 Tax=Porphyridium purpureum TaxID=35688 RepID=A0A5J4YTG0_PORPP|nr:E3 ubiquitin-protein ligase RFWD3 [Porphyridium purpureum]|eukprot:POR1960..scf227_4